MIRQKALPSMIDISIFEKALQDKNGLVLVPTERLANQVCVAWSNTKELDLPAWQAPHVYSILSWLKNCWDEMHDLHLESVTPWAMAERAQRLYFWEKTINQFNPGLGSRFSSIADETYNDLCAYYLSIDMVPSDTSGSRQFKLWCKTYAKLMRDNGFIQPNECWQLLESNLKKCEPKTYESIYLYGFQSIPPLQRNILGEAADQCVLLDPFCIDMTDQLDDLSQNVRPSFHPRYERICNLEKARKIKFYDAQEELAAAADWAAHELKIQPNQRIGILMPDLLNRLGETYRAINTALAAKNINIPVNFSVGIPLSATPIIAGALELLSSIERDQPLSHWLRLIYSPYTAFELLSLQEKANLEQKLRKNSQFNFTLHQFLYEIEKITTSVNMRAVVDTFRSLATAKEKSASRKSTLFTFSECSERMQTILDKQNWPGTRTLSSLEYQQLNQWHCLMEQFRGLDNLGERVNLSKAVQVLTSMANDHIFHEQTPDSSLQVLGLLDASGLQFGKAWILGLDHKTFPQLPLINPLLPAYYQKKHRLPRSDATRELAIARSLLQGFHANTGSLICSYPLQRDEELSIESPLLRNIKPSNLFVSPKSLGYKAEFQVSHQSAQSELYEQPKVPLKMSKEIIKGGAAILRNQFICPFNSFAIHRLGAKPIDPPHQGINQRQRGILIHEVLFKLWNQWKSSDKLNQLSDRELALEINESIDLTFSSNDRSMLYLRGSRYRKLEKLLINRLITAWLRKEKSREPFEVLELEQSYTVKFGELSLQLIVDRLDLVGGKRLIIDYKTGALKTSGWNPEELKEPQLPLYVVACHPNPNGFAFAHLSPDAIRLVGESDGLLSPELSEVEEWHARILDWKAALDKLAYSFSSGDCDTSVNDLAAFKQQYFLLPLNRFTETL